MKITSTQLRRIIKEEIAKAMGQQEGEFDLTVEDGMKSDADILKAHPAMAGEMESWPAWYLTEVAQAYVYSLAPVKDKLTSREFEAYANVIGKKDFSVADVIVLRLAIKTRGLRYRSPAV